MNIKRIVTWTGEINAETCKKVVEKLLQLFDESAEEDIYLLVGSMGGDVAIAFGFYDLVKGLGINLNTISLGAVKSAAVTIFLSGKRRLVSPHTTMLLHPIVRNGTALDLRDMESSTREFRIYNDFLVSIANECGVKNAEKFLDMQNEVTILEPKEIVELGFAHEIWQPQQ